MKTLDFQTMKAGDAPPHELPAHALYVVEDHDNLGPGAFAVDALLDSAFAIHLVDEGTPVSPALSAMVARGVVVVIDAKDTFRVWFNHLAKLGVLGKTLAVSANGDPRERLQ